MAIFETGIDLVPGFKFTVEIPGFGSINFNQVSGIGIEHRTQEYQAGGNPVFSELYIGTKFTDVTLRQGVSSSTQIYEWAMSPLKTYNEISKLQPSQRQGMTLPNVPEFRLDVTIKQFDTAGIEVRRWILKQAWVKSYSLEALDAERSEVSFDNIVLSHSGLVMADKQPFDTILNLTGRTF